MEKGDYTILDRVSWSVRQGQCWALKGLNGAGKSSIVKLITVRPPGITRRGAGVRASRRRSPHTCLALRSPLPLSFFCRQEAHEQRLQPQASPSPPASPHSPTTSRGVSQFTGHVAVGVGHMGLVSTETHLHLASRCALDTTASVVLSGLPPLVRQGGGNARQDEALRQWGELLRLSEATLARPFGELSQGQQKLAIIARALIGAPELVIMDEACQVGHIHDFAWFIHISC